MNHQVGTRSACLHQEVVQLLSWAEINLKSIHAEHLAGVQNQFADWLSRKSVHESEWKLHPEVFAQIVKSFCRPIMDLFASRDSEQVQRFLSRSVAQKRKD